MNKISIIVPIYNTEKYLFRCVESIRNQTYRDIEIILVNDGSKDRSGDICNQYEKIDSRIKVIHTKNRGASSARNIGLGIATGEYIGFVDSDDYIAVDMYEYLYNLIVSYTADVSICREMRTLNTNIGKEKKQIEKIVLCTKNEILNRFFRVNSSEPEISSCVRLYKTSLLENIRFIENMTHEDVKFSYDVFWQVQKVVVSNLYKYRYCLRDNSVTRKSLSEMDFSLIQMWDMVVELTKENTPEFLLYAKLNRVRAKFTLLCKMALHGLDEKLKDDLRIEQMLRNIRQEYWSLILYKGLPFNRKCALSLMYVNFSLFKTVVRFWTKKK